MFSFIGRVRWTPFRVMKFLFQLIVFLTSVSHETVVCVGIADYPLNGCFMGMVALCWLIVVLAHLQEIFDVMCDMLDWIGAALLLFVFYLPVLVLAKIILLVAICGLIVILKFVSVSDYFIDAISWDYKIDGKRLDSFVDMAKVTQNLKNRSTDVISEFAGMKRKTTAALGDLLSIDRKLSDLMENLLDCVLFFVFPFLVTVTILAHIILAGMGFTMHLQAAGQDSKTVAFLIFTMIFSCIWYAATKMSGMKCNRGDMVRRMFNLGVDVAFLIEQGRGLSKTYGSCHVTSVVIYSFYFASVWTECAFIILDVTQATKSLKLQSIVNLTEVTQNLSNRGTNIVLMCDVFQIFLASALGIATNRSLAGFVRSITSFATSDFGSDLLKNFE